MPAKLLRRHRFPPAQCRLTERSPQRRKRMQPRRPPQRPTSLPRRTQKLLPGRRQALALSLLPQARLWPAPLRYRLRPRLRRPRLLPVRSLARRPQTRRSLQRRARPTPHLCRRRSPHQRLPRTKLPAARPRHRRKHQPAMCKRHESNGRRRPSTPLLQPLRATMAPPALHRAALPIRPRPSLHRPRQATRPRRAEHLPHIPRRPISARPIESDSSSAWSKHSRTSTARAAASACG